MISMIASIHSTIIRCGMFLVVPVVLVAEPDMEKDIWHEKELIVHDLCNEWRNVDSVEKELEVQLDILASLLKFKSFQNEGIRLEKLNVSRIIRKTETILKKGKKTGSRLVDIKSEIADALHIFREMLVGEPVESMFEILEKGSKKRRLEMIEVRRSINSAWVRLDSILVGVINETGVMIQDEKAIVTMNYPERCFERFAQIKSDYVKTVGSELASVLIESDMESIRKSVAEQKNDLVIKKADAFVASYPEEELAYEASLIKAKMKMLNNEYEDVLNNQSIITASKEGKRLATMYRIQSMYGLQRYDSLLADTVNGAMYDLSGSDLNMALWLVMESCLKRGNYEVGLRFARLADKEKPYYRHVIYTLSKLYVELGDHTTALSILGESEQTRPKMDNDKTLLYEIKNLMAELYYKQGNYDKAIGKYYELLKNKEMFEIALLGISWCYIMTDNHIKAEFALRKLINQSPGSAAGAEAVLTMARNYMYTIKRLRDKHESMEKERVRLESLLSRVDMAIKDESNINKLDSIKNAGNRIDELLEQINNEKRSDYTIIMAHYNNIEKLCHFILSHYHTGTFQHNPFTATREKVLSAVDSALSIMRTGQNNGRRSINESNEVFTRTTIKKLIGETELVLVIAILDRYRWELGYIEWKKSRIRRMNAVLEGDKKTVTMNSEETIDSLIQYEYKVHRVYSDQLKEKITEQLSKKISRVDKCYLAYQLGELYYRDENRVYATQYDEYEIALSKESTKENTIKKENTKITTAKPSSPVLDHDKSMSYFRIAKEALPASVFAGAAIYGLAWCYNDLGKLDSAYFYMNKVAGEYPDNPHTPQALMFCGEYMFDQGELNDALESYYAVLKYPESDWFEKALYKIAWSQYRLSNPEKAISSFLALVDLGNGASGAAVLEKESMDYIAISFSEIDASGEKGLDRAIVFINKLNDKKRGYQIVHRLAQIYREQGRYGISLKAYAYLLSVYPDYEMNYRTEAELLAVKERDISIGEAIDQKYEYFKKYNRASVWAQAKSDVTKSSADSIAAKMLYDAAVGYHQAALQGTGKKQEAYVKAITSYGDYVRMYHKSPLANECHYNIAEIQFSLGHYRLAAEAFIAVSKLYSESKYRETAAWNAIVASQKVLKMEYTGKSEGTK